MIEPPNKKEIAEFLEVGLRLGAFDYSAAIQWADSVLLMEDRPDIQIVEISGEQRGATWRLSCCGHIAEEDQNQGMDGRSPLRPFA